MAYQDKTLTCRDCNQNFNWTAGEQEFYAQKGLENAPTRCQDCRKKRKETRQRQSQTFEITCAQCGQKGFVPFQPRDPSSVLCAECFRQKKASTTP
jgi:CxxC-x17-CxxC domain-containing protein